MGGKGEEGGGTGAGTSEDDARSGTGPVVEGGDVDRWGIRVGCRRGLRRGGVGLEDSVDVSVCDGSQVAQRPVLADLGEPADSTGFGGGVVAF